MTKPKKTKPKKPKRKKRGTERMIDVQAKIILSGISQRLVCAHDWIIDFEERESMDGYTEGTLDGACFVASCEIVQYVFPLYGIDGGLAALDVREIADGAGWKSRGKILKGLLAMVREDEVERGR